MNDLEIKYAPTKCKHFCLGDCCIDMKTCNCDYSQCDKSELKEQTDNEDCVYEVIGNIYKNKELLESEK